MSDLAMSLEEAIEVMRCARLKITTQADELTRIRKRAAHYRAALQEIAAGQHLGGQPRNPVKVAMEALTEVPE